MSMSELAAAIGVVGPGNEFQVWVPTVLLCLGVLLICTEAELFYSVAFPEGGQGRRGEEGRAGKGRASRAAPAAGAVPARGAETAL